MNDSGMYVGACKQACDVVIDHTWMENNALGYSGTNSGGTIVIENSQFDDNQDGLDTNTAIVGDPPARRTAPARRRHQPDHPHPLVLGIHAQQRPRQQQRRRARRRAARPGPIGTGMTVSGGRNDTVTGNKFSNNGAWGILFVPYPDEGTPVMGQTCAGQGGVEVPGLGCVLES